MNEDLGIKEILEWYLTAGVDETCGEVPFALAEPAKEMPRIVPAAVSAAVRPAENSARPATTELAQATINACQSARELCQKADRSGIPFVGRSGQLLEKMLKAIGFDRNECFITNVLPWRPPGNRTPTEGEIAVCLPFLKRQIDLVSPEAIMILGGSAANALLDNGEPISRMRGKWLEYKKSDGGKVSVLASFHPAYLLRNSGQKAKAWVDMLRMKQKLCNN